MRKFTRIQKRLLTIIVVLCILACAMFGLRQNSITNIGYSAWTYLKYGLIQYPLSSIGNAVNDFSNLWHAYDDNEYLTKQLAQQKNYQTAYEDERNKNGSLTLAHSRNSQMSFMYGFFFVKFLLYTVVCVVIVI